MRLPHDSTLVDWPRRVPPWRIVLFVGSSLVLAGSLVAGVEGLAAIAFLCSIFTGGRALMGYYFASVTVAESADRLWIRRGWKWQSVEWSSLREIALGSYRGVWVLTLFYAFEGESNDHPKRRRAQRRADSDASFRRLMLLMWRFPPWVLYPILHRHVTPSVRVEPGVFRALFSPGNYPPPELLNQRRFHRLPAEMTATPTVATPLTVSTWPSTRDRQFGVYVALAASEIAVDEANRQSLAVWANDIAESARNSGTWWLGAFIAYVRDDDTPPEGGLWIAMATALIGEVPLLDASCELDTRGRPARVAWGARRHELAVLLSPSNLWLNVVSEQPADPDGHFRAVLLESVVDLAVQAETGLDIPGPFNDL
jgi:hypothetical protein